MQVAGEGGDRAEGDERAAGENQPGVVGHAAEQVAGGVGLPGAGWPVEQQAALEMLAGGQQRSAMVGHRQSVPFDPAEHLIRQYDVVAVETGLIDELEVDGAHRRHRDVQQVPAVDVEPVA